MGRLALGRYDGKRLSVETQFLGRCPRQAPLERLERPSVLERNVREAGLGAYLGKYVGHGGVVGEVKRAGSGWGLVPSPHCGEFVGVVYEFVPYWRAVLWKYIYSPRLGFRMKVQRRNSG